MNWRAMWEYFSGQPVSFIDFVTFRWVRVMWARRHWPKLAGSVVSQARGDK
jgi:hypothetical protein